MAYKDPEEGRARDRERFRRRTAERIAQDLCPRCGKAPPAPERKVCGSCAGKRNRAGRARDARLRAAGKPRRNPERARACERGRSRRRAAECVARGLCAKCGKTPPVPDRTLCAPCAENRRAAERARYAAGKAAGKLYGGRDPKERRRGARGRTRRRYDAPPRGRPVHPVRLAPAGRGRHGLRAVPRRETRGRTRAMGRPAGGRPVRHMRGDHVRRRLALRALRCAGGQASSAEEPPPARKRYARRRARRLCTDCGAPSQGAARCPPCARRSHVRSAGYRGLPPFPPSYRVIETATGADHGTFESRAEVAACLAFARLSPDEVEIVPDIPAMAASW